MGAHGQDVPTGRINKQLCQRKVGFGEPCSLLELLVRVRIFVYFLLACSNEVAVSEYRCVLRLSMLLTDSHIEGKDPILDVPFQEIFTLIIFVHGKFSLRQG